MPPTYQAIQAEMPVQHLFTPTRASLAAFEQATAHNLDTLSAFSMPASALETAGKQDEVIRLKAALNEKDMELIELREQHMQLVARSQEARSNWETALESKDRAIEQLEEALASRQRALDAASRGAVAGQEEVSQSLAAAQARIKALEANLAEAHATVMSQSDTISDQSRQLEAARAASRQEVLGANARVRALQQELASHQHHHDQLQRETKQLQALVSEKDGRLADAATEQQRLEQQVEQLRKDWQQAETSARQQPQHLQEQMSQLTQQLQQAHQRVAAKEASSRKYKEAVRAFKVKLQERDEALSQRQAQVLELHTELSQLQRLLKMGPMGVSASGPLRSSRGEGPWPCGSPVKCTNRHTFSRGSAEDAVAAATDELERLRNEVHGFHVELAGLQAQLHEKDSHMQTALSDAAALSAERNAAVARAEEATNAVFHLERRLLDAQQAQEEAEKASTNLAEKLSAAKARAQGLQTDQARSIRAEGELRVQLERLQEELASKEDLIKQLTEQLEEAQDSKAEATRRMQQLEARALSLEARLDASSTQSGQALRRANRQESEVTALAEEVDTLQQQLEQQQEQAQSSVAELREQLHQQKQQARAELDALQQQLVAAKDNIRGSEAAAAGEQKRAHEMQLSCSRHMHELELRVQEAIQQAQSADRDRQRLETALAAAEAKAASADRRAATAESEMLLLGRSLRDAEAAVLEWQLRARQAEDSHQELSQMVSTSEAAVKQVQADLAQVHLAHSSERAQAQAQQQCVVLHQQQLEQALSDARASKADADLRLRDTEQRLADMRAAVDSQERLLLVLREQVVEGGMAAARVRELETTVQALEAALENTNQVNTQLRTTAAHSKQDMQATVDDLLSELAQKSSQLVDAERRFSELEAMMQRIASRTGQGQLVTAPGPTTLRSSVTGNGLCQLQRQCFEGQQQY